MASSGRPPRRTSPVAEGKRGRPGPAGSQSHPAPIERTRDPHGTLGGHVSCCCSSDGLCSLYVRPGRRPRPRARRSRKSHEGDIFRRARLARAGLLWLPGLSCQGRIQLVRLLQGGPRDEQQPSRRHVHLLFRRLRSRSLQPQLRGRHQRRKLRRLRHSLRPDVQRRPGRRRPLAQVLRRVPLRDLPGRRGPGHLGRALLDLRLQWTLTFPVLSRIDADDWRPVSVSYPRPGSDQRAHLRGRRARPGGNCSAIPNSSCGGRSRGDS